MGVYINLKKATRSRRHQCANPLANTVENNQLQIVGCQGKKNKKMGINHRASSILILKKLRTTKGIKKKCTALLNQRCKLEIG